MPHYRRSRLSGDARAAPTVWALLITLESSPDSGVLGRRPSGDGFADVATHPEYQTLPGPLVFPDAEHLAHEVRALVDADGRSPAGASADPDGAGEAIGAVPSSSESVRALILDLEAAAAMATTAADQSVALVAARRRSGLRVTLARSPSRLHGQRRPQRDDHGSRDPPACARRGQGPQG